MANGADDFLFSPTSGVGQFYLVLWLTEINGRIEQPHIEEMASANVRHGPSLIDVLALKDVPCHVCGMQIQNAVEAKVSPLSDLFTCARVSTSVIW